MCALAQFGLNDSAAGHSRCVVESDSGGVIKRLVCIKRLSEVTLPFSTVRWDSRGSLLLSLRACYELLAVSSAQAAAGNMSNVNTRKCSPPSTSGSRT